MRIQPATRSWNQTLGAGGDWGRRLRLHYAPLALASAVALILFMTLPTFDANKSTPGDIFSGTFPKEFDEGPGAVQHTGPPTGAMDHSGGQAPQQQGVNDQVPQQNSGGGRSVFGLSVRPFTFASGYVALVLLGLTLLIGPANLLLRRRRPVSNYLARDLGTWAAIFSVVHVIYGLQVHGSGKITDWLDYFVVDRSPLTNSFGWGNWTGLAATLIVVGLLALSNNFALGKLRARTWKNLQRLNYVLFALVMLHAFFYGALLRLASPFTLLLGVSVIAVVAGQAVGVWLWRRRYALTRPTGREPQSAGVTR